jgi:hypothetical protein
MRRCGGTTFDSADAEPCAALVFCVHPVQTAYLLEQSRGVMSRTPEKIVSDRQW